MHWRRLRQTVGEAIVLSMAFPQPTDGDLTAGRFARDAAGRLRGPVHPSHRASSDLDEPSGRADQNQ
jgi:hypothetical protein